MKQRLLMIEDDARLAQLVRDFMAPYDIDVVAVGTAAAGLQALRTQSFGLILLDLMLPDADGLELCGRLRQHSSVPVIMLTARGETVDRVVGLEMGADDYLPKPFDPRELLARIRAVLRRVDGAADSAVELLSFGRLELDCGARAACLDGQPLPLTAHQFDLLLVLARAAGRVQTREQLMDALSGTDRGAFDRSIDVQVARIRSLIEDDPKQPRRILTVRGSGYLFARSQT